MKGWIAGGLLAAGSLGFQAALADERVQREHRFDLTGIEEVEIEGSVGSIDIVPVQGHEMRVRLEIEGKDRGWFRGDKDVSDVDLTHRERGGRLTLNMTEKDTNTEWQIELPEVVYTRISMGVGSINGELGDTDLDVNLGVGDVDIMLPRASPGRIELSVGVGEANLRGGEIIDDERAFVAHNLRARGEGDKPLRVKAGVGDIRVELQ